MKVDPARQADQILQGEKARRPRWLRASRRAPGWFSGQELDLLEPAERDKLHGELRGRLQATQWLPLVLASANLATIKHGFKSESSWSIGIAIVVGVALLMPGIWILRRRSLLSMARRHVREGADWPLRIRDRAPGGAA
jgi:hypothetical protein